jgi:hypothetical protein
MIPPAMARAYADSYRGWPVAPRNRQHVVRGSFLDPRTKEKYHNGIDISVRDDKPERGAPRDRTHRVYALEGGKVWKLIPSRGDPGGLVRVGHFGYGHVDPVVRLGQRVRPGQLLGWTIEGQWHIHLTEWEFPGGDRERRIPVHPLDRRGKIAPYVDLFPPVIRTICFYTPASPPWTSPLGRAVFPDAGFPLDADNLSGLVDVRARIDDPPSFQAWLRDLPLLRAAHHPSRVHVTVTRRADGKRVVNRDVFKPVWLGAEARRPVPFSHHYAPGARQNLRASKALKLKRQGEGAMWFRLFAQPTGLYWDTTLLRNGPYRIRVSAWDVAGHRASTFVDVVIKN